MKKLRVVICGSRQISDPEEVRKAISDGAKKFAAQGAEIGVVMSGQAAGPDTIAAYLAQAHGIPVEKYPAEWSKYDRRAGIVRNEKMAETMEACIAIWDGTSRGTNNMIMLAQRKLPESMIHIHIIASTPATTT